MSDDPDALFEITWGPLRLWASSAATTNSRTKVIHELATGDDHPTSDRGLGPRTCRLSLLFDDFPGEPKSGIERLRDLIAQVEVGDDQIFVHPVRGAYLAGAGEFTHSIDEDGNVTGCELELIPNQPIEAVHTSGAGSSAQAGSGAVAARAQALADAELLAGLKPSDLPTQANAAQAGWDAAADEANPAPARQITADVATISAGLAAYIDDAGLEDDLVLWPVFQSTIFLGDAVRASAVAATSETRNTFVMRIVSPMSPLALVVRVYGGADAESYERQVRYLNDLQTPGGLFRAGDQVIMPARSSDAVF